MTKGPNKEDWNRKKYQFAAKNEQERKTEKKMHCHDSFVERP